MASREATKKAREIKLYITWNGKDGDVRTWDDVREDIATALDEARKEALKEHPSKIIREQVQAVCDTRGGALEEAAQVVEGIAPTSYLERVATAIRKLKEAR